MTAGQHAICHSAEQLFLERGYHGVSTKSIAQHAQVSEALIFKYYKSKSGLLTHLLHQWEFTLMHHLNLIEEMKDAKQQLKALLSLPFMLYNEQQKALCGLSRLKEAHQTALNYRKAITDLLEQALTEQFYKSPQQEAVLIILVIEQLSMALFSKNNKSITELKSHLLRKYHLEGE